jgi:fatty-acid desaturase
MYAPFFCYTLVNQSSRKNHDYSVTIGYHRLYSHRAFRASSGIRIALAVMGSSAFQGSIKVCESR